jgi:hypothetical protein
MATQILFLAIACANPELDVADTGVGELDAAPTTNAAVPFEALAHGERPGDFEATGSCLGPTTKLATTESSFAALAGDVLADWDPSLVADVDWSAHALLLTWTDCLEVCDRTFTLEQASTQAGDLQLDYELFNPRPTGCAGGAARDWSIDQVPARDYDTIVPTMYRTELPPDTGTIY